ncbi:MAG: pyridoxamine 5'-phosphate oxidase family protein [Desulfobacterales bacterium]|nr:pyridoxamine 5'-phosphate oxidase family protein [Desulfobacterales bacterium]MDD4073855.1 pyridoxamine 5'-phosphate oxidase family protein [Desulfobacterales bacterium]MDD4394040.1 pyridoxamine 5'-phosphate oxidase family protein [Desulfobacterales bacterium]
MELYDYFENTEGLSILSTASKDGKVDIAIYSRPHILEDGTAAFIMNDRLTHANVLSNPHAAFLFMEKGQGYRGKRMSLTFIREETDIEKINSLRRKYCPEEQEIFRKPLFLVVFTVDKVLPLIGSGD